MNIHGKQFMYAHSNNTAVTIQIVVNKPEMWKDFLIKQKW